MKFLEATKKYFALSSTQKKFIKNPKTTFNLPHRHLVGLLTPLAEFDTECDAAIAQLFKFNLAFFLTMFAGAFVGSASPAVGVVMVITGMLLLFIGIVIRIFLGSINIDNQLREFVLPLINTIGEDADPEKNMILKIDLGSKLTPDKRLSEKKDDPGWFSYPKVTTSIYQANWFRLQADLVDGSKVNLAIIDKITHRAKTVKNARGKIKPKSKSKTKRMFVGTVSLKNKVYSAQNTAALEQKFDRLKTREGEKRNTLTLTKIDNFAGNFKYPSPADLIDLIGKIYMSAQPAGGKGI